MFTFQAAGVIDILRASIAASLTTAGEPPWVVPLAFPLRPWSVDLGLLPLTLVEARNVQVHRDTGARSLLMECAVTVHHVRRRQPDMGGESVCLSRLGAVAAGLENDPRLLAVGGDTVPIHAASVVQMALGSESRLQQELALAGQDGTLAAGSLDVLVQWYEDGA